MTVEIPDVAKSWPHAINAVTIGATADGGQRASDEGGHQFVDQRQSVSFVRAKGEEGGDLVRIGGGISVGIDGAVGRERLVLALELFHPSHGDD